MTKNRLMVPAAVLTLMPFLLSPQTVYAADENEGMTTASAKDSSWSELDVDPMHGPDSVTGILQRDQQEKQDVFDKNFLEEWTAWKTGIKEETGFNFGADYTAIGFAASSSPGDDTAASGIARFFGNWDLYNRGELNTGSLVFKFEDRHSYTDVAPVAFGFEVGYAGTPAPVFSDQGFRWTTLYWKQNFADNKVVARAGFLDVKEYFNLYGLASPWTHFDNLAFSVGSNTMAVLPDAAFGAMAGGYLTDNVYAVAGILDRSADPTSMFDSFDNFFSDFDTLKTLEIGITKGGKYLFLDNAHISFWHLDESKETGAPSGRGVNVSFSSTIDGKWLPFLRAAWADEGGGVYESSVSTGFGYKDKPGGNLLGVGLNWGRPNSDTFPIELDDQWTGEVFYRAQLTENLQVTPSVQLLVDPALNPDKDFIALFGLRVRASF
ncbi:carbohydrate porin [Sulfurovum sp.]|uniref:carbohydrate porin n=1 Tax=Sulfurovum sp. TaxID=1969726 RepID=UPI00356B55ED